MKQHITIEQLNELNDEAKEKLREWWKPILGDQFAFVEVEDILEDVEDEWFNKIVHSDGENDYFDFAEKIYDSLHTDAVKAYPLLSIGQMIEFIDEKWDCWGMQYDDSTITWWVYSGQSLDMAMDWDLAVFDNYDNELCDALWEAIKFFII